MYQKKNIMKCYTNKHVQNYRFQELETPLHIKIIILQPKQKQNNLPIGILEIQSF